MSNVENIEFRPAQYGLIERPEPVRRSRKRWGLIATVAGGVLATSLLISACTDSVTPTVDTADLGEHNVPFVSIDFKDTNGDGLYNRTDAYNQEEGNWRFDLDMIRGSDGVFRVDEDDIALHEQRVCTLPVLSQFDSNVDGHITEDDVEITRDNQGVVIEDPNPNTRLDKLDGGGIILEGDYENPSKRNHLIIPTDITGRDPYCDSSQ